jgi:hypothetical protein
MSAPVYDAPVDVESIKQFDFQVAGHGALLKLPDGRICKPLIPQELWFYQSLENRQSLRKFTAPFHGTIIITFNKEYLNTSINNLEKQQQEAKKHEISEQDSVACDSKKYFYQKQQPVINPWSLKVTKSNFGNLLQRESFVTSKLICHQVSIQLLIRIPRVIRFDAII